MAINSWSLLADLEEEFGDKTNQPRGGPGYSEGDVDTEWELEELKFRDSL